MTGPASATVGISLSPTWIVSMASKWIERTCKWSRQRFIAFSVVVAIVCIALLVLDGLSAAVHFHVGVAVFGVAFFVVLAIWFKMMEARAEMLARDR